MENSAAPMLLVVLPPAGLLALVAAIGGWCPARLFGWIVLLVALAATFWFIGEAEGGKGWQDFGPALFAFLTGLVAIGTAAGLLALWIFYLVKRRIRR